MKILNNPEVANTSNVKGNRSRNSSSSGKVKASGSGTGKAKKADQVNISNVAQNISNVKAELKDIPDVRLSKVREMEAKVRDGYNPPAVEVADAIIRTVSILS